MPNHFFLQICSTWHCIKLNQKGSFIWNNVFKALKPTKSFPFFFTVKGTETKWETLNVLGRRRQGRIADKGRTIIMGITRDVWHLRISQSCQKIKHKTWKRAMRDASSHVSVHLMYSVYLPKPALPHKWEKISCSELVERERGHIGFRSLRYWFLI